MQPKAPIRHLRRRAHHLRILPRHGRRVRLTAREEVKVEHPADDIVLQRRRAVGVVELDVHAVGVEEEDAVCAGWAMLLVDGVRTVEVGAGGHEGCFAVELGERSAMTALDILKSGQYTPK